jgi:hypothetical protein
MMVGDFADASAGYAPRARQESSMSPVPTTRPAGVL